MDLEWLMKKCLVGVVLMMIWVRPSYGVLMQDNGLILDSDSGLYWAPVGRGAVAPKDLTPNFRYATSTEVNDLLRYIPTDPCINVAPSTACGNQTLQAVLDFIDIFQTGLPNRLRAIYDPSLFPDGTGMAMALSLFVNLQNQFIAFDTQSVNFHPADLDEGMLLVLIAVPELSTLLLIGSGALIGLWFTWKKW